jgi:Ca-activated chloride channel family protein
MRTIVVCLCSLILSPTAGFGEDGPRLFDHDQRTHAPAQTTTASIRVNVDMALVPVSVLDPRGQSVLGLDRENFCVFDDKEQRPIISFGRQDGPMSIGLIYDTSRSMSDKFKVARQAPVELFQHLNPEDEAFLVTVAEKAQLRHSFTSKFEDIQNALLFVSPKGTTSLIDGIVLGLQQAKKARNPRRALIVVSDGGDNNSRYTLSELTSLAAEADTQIFTVCVYDHPQTQEEMEGPALLEHLALASGGTQYVISDVNELRRSLGNIAVNLHNQYVLGYYPPDQAQSGKYRKIQVKVMLPKGLPKLKVFARSGYYVPEK